MLMLCFHKFFKRLLEIKRKTHKRDWLDVYIGMLITSFLSVILVGFTVLVLPRSAQGEFNLFRLLLSDTIVTFPKVRTIPFS